MSVPFRVKVAAMKSQKRFLKVNVEISNICNLQCSFCPEVIREKGKMSLALFERVIEQVAPLTEMVCLHLMGEPLVHSELGEIIEICESKKVKIFLVTNGVLLRDKHVRLLLKPAMKQVNFSLHSFFDNFKDRDPTQYLERIFSFTEKAFLERPDLYINYRLWNLQETKGAGAQNKMMLSLIEERFQMKMRTDIDVKIQKSIQIKNKLYLNFDTEFTWPALDLPVLSERGTCKGLSNHFGVLIDGTVVPCCLDKEAGIPLGKIQDSPIDVILSSPRAKKLLEGFKQGKLIEALCQRCQYIERFQ